MLHFKMAVTCALLSAAALGQLQGGGHGVSVRRTGCHLDLESHADCDVRANGVPLGGLSDTVNAMSSTIAAMQSVAAVQSAAAETRHATQDTTIAQLTAAAAAQSEAGATQNSTIAALLATVGEQAATIATLQPDSAGTGTDFCPGMAISSDAQLALFAPVTRPCVYMSGDLRVRYISNATLLAEAFPNLRVASADVSIGSSPNLASIDGSFPNLETVGEQFAIRRNPLLTSVGSSFGNLRSVGSLVFYENGGTTHTGPSTAGSAAFCQSARGALCATTTNYPDTGRVDDALACCSTSAPTAAPTATPSASLTSLACPGLTINSDAELALAVPAYRTCVNMTGDLYITHSYGTGSNGRVQPLLTEAFPNLQIVTGQLGIEGDLRTSNLASLDGTFPNLMAVGGNLRINHNPLLTSLGSGFGSLQSVGGALQVFANGQFDSDSSAGSRSFCASARGALCPTTTSYVDNSYADGANACCTAYCLTTTDC